QVVGQGAPLIAAAHHIEDGVDDLAPAVARRATAGLDGGHEGLQDGPLGGAPVAGIGFAGRGEGVHAPSLPHPNPLKTVSNMTQPPALQAAKNKECEACISNQLIGTLLKDVIPYL